MAHSSSGASECLLGWVVAPDDEIFARNTLGHSGPCDGRVARPRSRRMPHYTRRRQGRAALSDLRRHGHAHQGGIRAEVELEDVRLPGVAEDGASATAFSTGESRGRRIASESAAAECSRLVNTTPSLTASRPRRGRPSSVVEWAAYARSDRARKSGSRSPVDSPWSPTQACKPLRLARETAGSLGKPRPSDRSTRAPGQAASRSRRRDHGRPHRGGEVSRPATRLGDLRSCASRACAADRWPRYACGTSTPVRGCEASASRGRRRRTSHSPRP